MINPPADTVYNEGDQIIAISEDDDTVIVSGKKDFNINKNVFSKGFEVKPKIEKTLILGWNESAKDIIRELDEYVAPGSEVFIVSVDDQDISDIELQNQSIQLGKGNLTDQKTIESLHPELYDHIILLSNPKFEIQESDARTLICFLHLRNLSEKHNKHFSIVSEMKDMRNRELGQVAKADDFIVGDNIISLMMSQLSENSDLKKVFDVLFESEGSEIYLKPINRYINTSEAVNFYTVMERAFRTKRNSLRLQNLRSKR